MTTASRHDPLRNFQFRIKLLHGSGSNEYVAGVKRVSGLSLSIGVNETWSGGNSLHRYADPDKVTWDTITLEQGLALDDSLAQWAQAVLAFVQTAATPPVPIKRNVAIDVWDPHRSIAGGSGTATGRMQRFIVYNAWISRYQALPQLDAMGNEVALLSVELVHEGWRAADPDELPSDICSFPSAAGTGSDSGEGSERRP